VGEVLPGDCRILASRESGIGKGRDPGVASILRLGSARERGCDHILRAVRVGELGGCRIHLHTDSSGTVEAATATR